MKEANNNPCITHNTCGRASDVCKRSSNICIIADEQLIHQASFIHTQIKLIQDAEGISFAQARSIFKLMG